MNPADAAHEIPAPQTQMAFACEGISTDPFQRISFNNVIDQLSGSNFPAVTPQFFAVFGFEASIPQIVSRVHLLIVGPEQDVVIEVPLPDIVFTNNQFKTRVVQGFAGMPWPRPGIYRIKLMAAQRELASFAMSVVHQPAPNA